MEDKITRILSLEDSGGDDVKVTVLLSKEDMASKFNPYYEIQREIKDKILPILVEEVLKNKDEIIKKVLLEVNWPEIVRSEVARRVIAEAGKTSNY